MFRCRFLSNSKHNYNKNYSLSISWRKNIKRDVTENAENMVFACGKSEDYMLPDNALIAFMNHCANRIGESYFRTPRTTIKAFLDLLSILEQYPSVKWTDVIENIDIIADSEQSGFGKRNISQSENNSDDEFASFKL